MTREEIKSSIIEILNDTLPETEIGVLEDNVPISQQLEMDSMDFLDIIMAIKMKYKVEVLERDYENITSINSTIDYLKTKLANA